MTRVKLLIYDDQRGAWGPLTDLRPIFDQRSGIVTYRQRIERALGQSASALVVAERLAMAMRERELKLSVNASGYKGRWRAVNGRWNGCGEPPQGAVVELDGRELADFLRQPPSIQGDNVIARPWQILDQLEQTLSNDLTAWCMPRVAASANVHPSAVIDESQGIVVIDEHVTLEPLSVVQGPAYIGPHSVVRSFAHLRHNTVLGPHSRVGGEISFTLIQGYTNKPHTGFLGHALVGQWTNLGASTTVSNLKNTYGPIRVQLSADQDAEDSGRTFLGPVIGDHCRLGVGTLVRTGAVIGSGCMIALPGRFTPRYVPPLTFLTETGPEPYDITKLLATSRTTMRRRGTELNVTEADLLAHLAD